MLTSYLLVAALVYLINVIPAFMPPTWTILAFFFIYFKIPLIPLVIIGASMATLGRVSLALIARRFRHLFPKSFIGNYDYLGQYLDKHQKLTIPIILGYAFLPISSNYVYIIAGLTNLSLKIIAFSFFAGRLFSYTFWVSASFHISQKLEDIFAQHLAKRDVLILQGVSFLLVYLVGKINWKKILK